MKFDLSSKIFHAETRWVCRSL